MGPVRRAPLRVHTAADSAAGLPPLTSPPAGGPVSGLGGDCEAISVGGSRMNTTPTTATMMNEITPTATKPPRQPYESMNIWANGARMRLPPPVPAPTRPMPALSAS